MVKAAYQFGLRAGIGSYSFLVCFPSRQDIQVSFSAVIFGRPITSPLLIIVFIVSVLTCPNLACHLEVSVGKVICRHSTTSACRCTLYSRFFDLEVLIIKYPVRSKTLSTSSFILTSQPTSVACPKDKILLRKPCI